MSTAWPGCDTLARSFPLDPRNGVSAARIRTISYGKERPVAVCNDISCWSQNRRAQTVLNSRGCVGNAVVVAGA